MVWIAAVIPASTSAARVPKSSGEPRSPPSIFYDCISCAPASLLLRSSFSQATGKAEHSAMKIDLEHLSFPGRHQPIFAPRGAVATSQPLAAQAGIDAL